MELFDTIAQRHSYRGPMEPTPVPREDLERIVTAGIRAPSGKNAQTTEFVIIDDEKLLGVLQGLHPANKAMQQAPAMIACIIDKQPTKIHQGYDFQLEDCAAATENMLLAITALGYASVWIDGWLRVDGRAETVAKLLQLPEGKKVQILLPVGRPKEQWHPKERRPFSTRVTYNHYPKPQEPL